MGRPNEGERYYAYFSVTVGSLVGLIRYPLYGVEGEKYCAYFSVRVGRLIDPTRDPSTVRKESDTRRTFSSW
jgi:hypothetical protein